MTMTNWSTGLSQIPDAAALRDSTAISSKGIVRAASDAAANIIETGDLGDGPYDVQISSSSNDVPGGVQSLTITVNAHQPVTAP
ncbi:MAG: hypothetical protein WKF96_00080 [Solirubrobacteraceae bacterium]